MGDTAPMAVLAGDGRTRGAMLAEQLGGALMNAQPSARVRWNRSILPLVLGWDGLVRFGAMPSSAELSPGDGTSAHAA
jgi:hypothetical protein